MENGSNLSDRYSKNLIKGKVTATAGVRNSNGLLLSYGVDANRYDILKLLEKNSVFKVVWYSVFIVLGIICLIIEPKSYLQVLDLYVLMINVDLVGRGKLSGIYIGIAECVLYSYISYRSGLYGEIIKMMGISVPLNIVAIINWSKNLKREQSESNEITVKKLSKKGYIIFAVSFVAVLVPAYFFLKLLGTSAIVFSTIAFTVTIFVKILNGFRYVESWVLYIVSDVVSFIMWLYVIISTVTGGGALPLTELPMLLLYLACLSNSIYSYGMWKVMYRRVAVNGRVYLAKRKVNIKRIARLRRTYKEMVWNKQIDMAKNS